MNNVESIVEQFAYCYRHLELARTNKTLEDLSKACANQPLPDVLAQQIINLVFPIFYPGNNSSSKLKFTIQCNSASYLAKILPSSKIEIMRSILEAFQHYPNIFSLNSPMFVLLEDLIDNSTDFWHIFARVSSSYDIRTVFSFIVFCVENTNASMQIGWEAISPIITNGLSSLIKSIDFSRVIEFMRAIIPRWPPNPIFASTLFCNCLPYLQLGSFTDVPLFLMSDCACPNKEEELIIQMLSVHCGEQTPQTARALTFLLRPLSVPPIFYISTLLAVIRAVHISYAPQLIQKLISTVKQNHFSPMISAHIAVAASLCNVIQFSFIDYFLEQFSSNEFDQSNFFAYLSESPQIFPCETTFSLARDVGKSLAKNISLGTCIFISKLLTKFATGEFVHGSLPSLAPLMDHLYRSSPASCAFLAGQIIAKFYSATDIVPTMTISLNICTNSVYCSAAAHSLMYKPFPIEVIALCFYISLIFDFEDLIPLFTRYVYSKFSTDVFPPADFKFEPVYAENIFQVTKQRIRMVQVDLPKLYQNIISLLPHVYCTHLFVKTFWVEATPSQIPVSTIGALQEILDDYEILRPLLARLLAKDDIKNVVLECCENSSRFRTWFITRVLSSACFKSTVAIWVAIKLSLSKIEYGDIRPAIQFCLTSYPAPHVMRAAAIKFIGKYHKLEEGMTEYAVGLAVSVLKRAIPPAFPNERAIDFSLMNELPLAQPFNEKGPSSELEAALNVISTLIKEGYDEVVGISTLDTIHKTLACYRDSRVRKAYLKFLASLGIRGAPYAAQVASNIQVPPQF